MIRDETVATALGYAGLIPFVVLAIGAWLPLPGVTHPVEFLIAYGAVILAFMGAIHWGSAMAGPGGLRAKYFIASVIPALVAWITLLMPQLAALVVLLAGFIGLYVFDRTVGRSQGFPHWYVPMRQSLTGVVALCLVSTIIAVMTR